MFKYSFFSLRLAALAALFLLGPVYGAVVTATFGSASTVPVTAAGYTATGNTVNLTLSYTPAAGTNLTVVKNTGLGFITGRFSNLSQGQVVSLVFNGSSYRFAANYYGGTGNDLVLHWADPVAYGWGNNAVGQLGVGNTSVIRVPTAVVNTGVLAGKTIVALSGGDYFSLALCADGTVASWGRNNVGQLGNNSTVTSNVPIDITQSGVLAGRTVIAVSAGYNHSLALCSDGTVAAWGTNGNGQLGNNSTTSSLVPVAVTSSGVLTGRTVVAIDAGNTFNVALCSDGKPVTWGSGGNGQLGNGTIGYESFVPVNVTTTGALSGRLVGAVSAGGSHAVALCTDGTLVAWGSNNYGESGTLSGNAPVLVSPLGALAGKTVTAISAGNQHNLALCTDGTLAAWGYNSHGELGNGSYLNSGTPVAVTTTGALAGKTVTGIAAGYTHSAALSADGSLAVWGDNSAYQFGNQSSSSYENLPVAVLTTPFGQAKGVLVASGHTAYHSFALAAAPALSSDSTLSSLTVDAANLSPGFAPSVTNYSVCVANAVTAVTVRPTASRSAAGITVNGEAVASGAASQSLSLIEGSNSVSVVVTAADGSTRSYTLTVLRPGPVAAHFSAPGVVPVSFPAYDATGLTVSISLGFVPVAGSDLTIIDNTGLRFIQGRFSNLPQGAPVTLTFGSIGYAYVADYFGGDGNDLVLHWANAKTYTAGRNASGQLGNSTITDSKLPVSVLGTGALAGKVVTAVAAGKSHTLALCADGIVAAWGDNSSGQLGNGSGGTNALSTVPVAVDVSGVLAGKVVAAIAAGDKTSYALCADGTVVAWGDNTYGKLGFGSTAYGSTSNVPVAVVHSGVLAGRQVVAIAAGDNFCLALCADGKMASWGLGYNGLLGNGGNADSGVPVAVSSSGKLAGKTVTRISAGANFSIALCSDGTLVSWGANWFGQLGDNSTVNSSVPTAVDVSTALVGRTVNSIAAGGSHSLALCSDGTLVAWGNNDSGKFGDNSSVGSGVPVVVPVLGARQGRSITAIAAGMSHSFAVCSDGTLMGWGSNYYGQLGTGDTTSSRVPVALATAALGIGVRITEVALGGSADHLVALGAIPDPSSLAELTALSLSAGTLSPAFLPDVANYTASVPNAIGFITVTPTALNASIKLTVNGLVVNSGVASAPVALAEGANPITVVATSPDGATVKTHTVTVTRGITLNAAFASVASVPVTAAGYTAAGSVINLSLGFAPATGANLTVINNTAPAFIAGQFSNLAQFQLVDLTYNNVTYRFVVNYFGGTGNDLVLQWANDRIYTWGNNYRGQLGNNSSTNSSVPVAIGGGPLAGKVVVRLATGTSFCLALCSDGTMAAWGDNSSGQLGNATKTDRSVPVAVKTDGALAGKTVISIAAGESHSLALCSDGTLFAWGKGSRLGNGGDDSSGSSVPVAVATNGELAGKTVTAIAAGSGHNLVMCSDGTLLAWGNGNNGQLGNGGTAAKSTPTAVTATGVLAGKIVTSIAAGVAHSMALCADGTLASWGLNANGQIGNNNLTNSLVPVAINGFGALTGKSVVAISAGGYHGMALRSDGVLTAWGYNNYGQLGINSTTDSKVPVAVNTSGVLRGKTVRTMAAGDSHCLVLCADGTMAGWGRNYEGQIGNSSIANSSVPVATVTSSLAGGEKFMSQALSTTGSHSMAMVAVPLPTATGLAATALSGTGATLNGRINANNNAVTVSFDYGLDSSYGNTLAGTPGTVTGVANTAVNASINGLVPGTTYHYRVVASTPGGTVRSEDMTFATLSDNARLAGLGLNDGTLVPGFGKLVANYIATVPNEATGVTVTPTTEHAAATVKVNGAAVASGAASGTISLPVGNTPVNLVVTAEDGVATKTYTINVTRLPEVFAFGSAADVPVTAGGFAAGGHPVVVALSYPPVSGTVLTMVNNTGLGFIAGAFGNLAQGQRISLDHDGKTYDFVANYFGGTGNDLVLQWADTGLAAWGSNSFGQLGDGTNTRRLRPTWVNDVGALADKTVTATAAGYLHSLALCSDGTLAAWGYNLQGQLGNAGGASSQMPVAVTRNGVLANRTVVAVAAGAFHSIVLCADGTVATWGYNNHGQLGDGTTINRAEPVRVDRIDVLANRRVVAVAAGAYHSFALCDDGTVAAWGFNDEGELGDGSVVSRTVPVAVSFTGLLGGKRVASIAAGQYHALALCTDGTLAGWGYNHRGQLGKGNTVDAKTPVEITKIDAIKSKVVTAVAAGGYHTLALCSDGTVAAWGTNNNGQIGASGIPYAVYPRAVDTTAMVAGGGLPVVIAAGSSHSMARGTDGVLFAWGDNADGQLGDSGVSSRPEPGVVDCSALAAGVRVMAVASSSAARHNLALVALPVGRSQRTVAGAAAGLPGTAGDQADVNTLLSEAFGWDVGAGSGQLPQARRIGDEWVIAFTEPAGVSGILYGAEWSEALLEGTWQPLPDSGDGAAHRFAVPVVNGGKAFIRLKVTRVGAGN